MAVDYIAYKPTGCTFGTSSLHFKEYYPYYIDDPFSLFLSEETLIFVRAQDVIGVNLVFKDDIKIHQIISAESVAYLTTQLRMAFDTLMYCLTDAVVSDETYARLLYFIAQKIKAERAPVVETQISWTVSQGISFIAYDAFLDFVEDLYWTVIVGMSVIAEAASLDEFTIPLPSRSGIVINATMEYYDYIRINSEGFGFMQVRAEDIDQSTEETPRIQIHLPSETELYLRFASYLQRDWAHTGAFEEYTDLDSLFYRRE